MGIITKTLYAAVKATTVMGLGHVFVRMQRDHWYIITPNGVQGPEIVLSGKLENMGQSLLPLGRCLRNACGSER